MSTSTTLIVKTDALTVEVAIGQPAQSSILPGLVEAFRGANARPWDNVTVVQRFNIDGEFPFSFTVEVPARDPQTAYRKIRDALAPGKVIRVQSN